MNTASSRQSLQDSEIDPSGLPSRYGDFLLGPAGLALSFLWGLAEATFFFVVPDVLLSLVAVFSLRRTWRHIALAVAGAISGGAFMFLWAQSDPDGAQAAVKKVPFVTEKMVVQVDAEYHRSGMVAVYMGPTTGTPYKIYAVEAPKFVSFAPFVLATIPARGWRFVLVSLFSAGCSAALRKYWKKSFRQLTLWHAAAWTAFYIFYWTRIAMS